MLFSLLFICEVDREIFLIFGPKTMKHHLFGFQRFPFSNKHPLSENKIELYLFEFH